MSKIDQPALLLGRSLLAFYFILPGVAKFAAWQKHIDLMHHHNVPFAHPLLFAAAIDFLIFGIIFGLNTLFGSIIIILTSLYILRREAKVKENKEQNLQEI